MEPVFVDQELPAIEDEPDSEEVVKDDGTQPQGIQSLSVCGCTRVFFCV